MGKTKEGVLLQNAVKVGDKILISIGVHDYMEHDGIMIDGGLEYQRRAGDWKRPDVIDLTITSRMRVSTCADRLLWGTYGKTGMDKFKWVLLKDCTSEHLGNILMTQMNTPEHISKAICYILHKRAVEVMGKDCTAAIGKDYTSFFKNRALAMGVAAMMA